MLGEINFKSVVDGMLIDARVYLLFIFIYIICFFFMLKSDGLSKKNPLINKSSPAEIISLSFLSLGLFLVGLVETGWAEFFFGVKGNDVELSAFLGISVWAALVLFSLSYKAKKLSRTGILVSLFIIGSFLLFGARSYAAILLLTFVLLRSDFEKKYAAKDLGLVIGMAVCVFLFASFKLFYKVLKSSSLELIFSNLADQEIEVYYTLILADPLAVIYNLNLVVYHEKTLHLGYLVHRVVSIIPFFGGVISEINNGEYLRFSDILKNEFHNVPWGLASTFIGELLALIGYSGTLIVLFLWIFLIYVFNTFLSGSFTFFGRAMIPALIYAIFYIHRVDITFVLGAVKTTLVVFLFVALSTSILKRRLSLRK